MGEPLKKDLVLIASYNCFLEHTIQGVPTVAMPDSCPLELPDWAAHLLEGLSPWPQKTCRVLEVSMTRLL